MALEHTARGAARRREASSGPATLCEKGPRDRPSRGTMPRSASAGVGGRPLRGVGLAAWPSRWVTGGPDLLRRSGNRRTWRRAAPNCEIRARHPLRKSPLGQNQAGSHASNGPPSAWRGAPSRGIEQMSELLFSRFRRCFVSKLRLGTRASRFSPACKIGEALRFDVARGSKKYVPNIVPNTRDFSVVFVSFFGHFRRD